MPLEKRPLDFMSGVGWLAEKVPIDTQIAPVTFYYAFMNEQRPRLYIHLGNSISNLVLNETREETRVKIEAIVSEQLDQQRFNIINGLTSAYQVSMYGTKSVSDWLNLRYAHLYMAVFQ
ncbi:hypothetical protein [Shouchella patagoniensis]|uniref:hypothetical protein n=1 Tax=Shouchella patagoniensis TaxID=228576 RepID=UPI001FE348F8|nr:hypothetical protein [Shouchella patagoniensis]